MDYSVIRMNENTWRIEDGGVRFFLLAGTEKALLIDTGMSGLNARDIATGLTGLPLFLLNTHADRDHIAGNGQFETFYMHPLEAPVYRRWGKPGTIIPVEDGDTLDLGERPLHIIHLPGHTPGSIAVLDARNRVLISGDPIQAHGNIFMFGSHRNMADYVRSLERLEAFGDRFDEIWPSHADISIAPDTVQKLLKGARDVLADRIRGVPTEMHGTPVMAYDVGISTLLCDR